MWVNRNLTSKYNAAEPKPHICNAGEPKPHICNAGEPKPHICNKGEPKPHICNGANRNLTSVMGVNRNLTSVMGQTETSHLKWRTPEPHICTLLKQEFISRQRQFSSLRFSEEVSPWVGRASDVDFDDAAALVGYRLVR
jgi:hypothetical protein